MREWLGNTIARNLKQFVQTVSTGQIDRLIEAHGYLTIIGCADFYAIPENGDQFFGQPPYYVIHNPRTFNTLPQPWLPGAIEYAVTELKANSLQLDVLPPLQPDRPCHKVGIPRGITLAERVTSIPSGARAD